MGNNLDAYRAAIGLFHACKMSLNIGYDSHSDTFHDILITNLRCSFLFASLLILQSLNPKVNVAFVLFVLHFLLLVGNIESNPGPESAYISSTPLSAVDILSDKSISICNINIRSIRNKINFLQNFVDEFDIIVLTEPHLDNSIENRDIELDSFDKNPQRKDRTNSGGGLLIYSKEDIGICRKHELENDIDETIWVEVHAKGHSFLLCNTYRPEWTDSEYWARLNHAIGLAYQVNENIVISGDLNSDLMSLNNNKLIDMMRLFNFKNVIEKPTRVTNHSRTLLDPIIVSDTINYVFSDVFKLPDNISDHDASVVILQCSKNISRSFKREIWQYQKINYEKFEEKLNEINWNEKLDHLNDVDEMCEKFTKCFLKIAQECIPTKIITIRNNDRPWFNNEIRKEIRIRDRFRKTVLKFHRERDIKLCKKTEK